jgi:hypothetical protein
MGVSAGDRGCFAGDYTDAGQGPHRRLRGTVRPGRHTCAHGALLAS